MLAGSQKVVQVGWQLKVFQSDNEVILTGCGVVRFEKGA